jgi:outer membrane protein assembly factor BamB
MPSRSPGRPAASIIAAFGFAAAAVALASCSTADAVRDGARGGDRWSMFGGGPGRSNSSTSGVAPPLVRLWEYDAGAGFGPASVAVADSTVYVGTLVGEVRAVDLVTGREIHSNDLGEAIFGTPLVAGPRIVLALSASEENLISYDAVKGEKAWAVETGDVESSPLSVGGMIVVALVDGAIAAYDTADGREIWIHHFPRSYRSPGIRSSPSSDGERIFAGNDAGEIAGLRASDGQLLWTAPAGGAVFGTVPAAEGRVIASTLAGTIRAFDAATGKPLWTFEAGAPIYGAAAVSGGAVVAGTSAGDLVALRPADGSLIWRSKCAGGVGAAPLISGGLAYAGDLGGQLAAFDIATGAKIWNEQIGGRIRATPVAADGRLIVLTEDAKVICFGKPGEGPGGPIAPAGGGEKK